MSAYEANTKYSINSFLERHIYSADRNRTVREIRGKSRFIKRSEFTLPTAGLDPSADSIFSILRHSDLKPRRIDTISATIYLKYVLNGDCERIVILPTVLDRGRSLPERYRGYVNTEELGFVAELYDGL